VFTWVEGHPGIGKVVEFLAAAEIEVEIELAEDAKRRRGTDNA
jgi:hypothetical protein